jgi:Undecaprenyl-phosphate glucose phosphotransferase
MVVRVVSTSVAAKQIQSSAELAAVPRRPARRPVSRRVVACVAAASDAAIIAGAGVMPMVSMPVAVGAGWQVAVPSIGLGAVLAVNLMHLLGAYSFRVLGKPGVGLRRCAIAWLVTMVVIAGVLHISNTVPTLKGWWLPLWWACGTISLALARFVVFRTIESWRRTGRLEQLVAVVGAGPIAQRLLRRWGACPDIGLEVVGIYDDRLGRLPPRCMGHRVVGTVDDLVRDMRIRGVDRIIVALPLSADRRLSEVMTKLSLLPVDVGLCIDQFGFQLKACAVSHIGDLTFLDAVERPLRDWSSIAKKLEDRILATLILILIAPVLATIAILVKLDSPGPVLFRQKRYGFNNQLIEVFKFRTMYHHASDPNAEKLACRNDPRVTRLGAFLRRTSADELPQFINVLRGEMSIVGPRPHALAAKAGGLLYQDAVLSYDARHRVKPGITGWAQVNGWRGETETTQQIAKRVEHDLYYIENWSLLLDLKIILRTIFGSFMGGAAY